MQATLAPDSPLSRVSVSAGRAVIRVNGALVRIEEILGMPATGATPEEMALAFPGIQTEHVAIARLHGLALARGASRAGAFTLVC